MGGTFAAWQPRYAEAGIATFPVRNKRPAVKGYLKLGKTLSSELVAKFPDDEQFGFACKPNGITVLDIDAPDEKLLCDALSEFGPTPVIIRSGSGNYQAWYRHNGEGRQVRPDPNRPIDILGAGFVVASPSAGKNGRYEFLQGSLADVQSLPVMRRLASPPLASPPRGLAVEAANDDRVQAGKRNDTLWRLCMVRARSCQRIEELMQAAVQLNHSTFYEPLSDVEVLKIVASAWSKQILDENWFGGGQRLVLDYADVDGLMSTDPDGFLLLTRLKRHHWGREFAVANAMHETMPGGGWRRERFTAARKRLEQMGEIVMIRPQSGTRPTLYKLKNTKLQGAQK